MIGHKEGDTFEFQNEKYTILKIETYFKHMNLSQK